MDRLDGARIRNRICPGDLRGNAQLQHRHRTTSHDRFLQLAQQLLAVRLSQLIDHEKQNTTVCGGQLSHDTSISGRVSSAAAESP